MFFLACREVIRRPSVRGAAPAEIFCLELCVGFRADKRLINLGFHQLRVKIITYRFEDSKEERRDKKGRG